MHELFFSTHRKVQEPPASTGHVSTSVIANARTILCSQLPMPDPRLILSAGRNIRNLEEIFQRILDEAAGIWPTTQVVERRFLNNIILHRLYVHYKQLGKLYSVAKVTTGAMSQCELIQLLLEVDPQQVNQLTNTTYTRGSLGSGMDFVFMISGAMACVRVIRNLQERPEAQLFFPDVDEDTLLGIDLFWMEQGLEVALSVKSDVSEQGIKGYNALRSHGKDDHSGLNREIRRVRDGVVRLNAQLEMDWIPALVRVGERPSKLVDLVTTAGTPWHEQLAQGLLRYRGRRKSA